MLFFPFKCINKSPSMATSPEIGFHPISVILVDSMNRYLFLFLSFCAQVGGGIPGIFENKLCKWMAGRYVDRLDREATRADQSGSSSSSSSIPPHRSLALSARLQKKENHPSCTQTNTDWLFIYYEKSVKTSVYLWELHFVENGCVKKTWLVRRGGGQARKKGYL